MFFCSHCTIKRSNDNPTIALGVPYWAHPQNVARGCTLFFYRISFLYIKARDRFWSWWSLIQWHKIKKEKNPIENHKHHLFLALTKVLFCHLAKHAGPPAIQPQHLTLSSHWLENEKGCQWAILFPPKQISHYIFFFFFLFFKYFFLGTGWCSKLCQGLLAKKILAAKTHSRSHNSDLWGC